PRSSSPEPEVEPRRKRPFQAQVQVPAQNPEEPLSQGSLVMKFTQVLNRNRQPKYSVEFVSKADQ
ncbi:hypothetical protein WMY93_034225, partial [Mugilogobius chulae]